MREGDDFFEPRESLRRCGLERQRQLVKAVSFPGGAPVIIPLLPEIVIGHVDPRGGEGSAQGLRTMVRVSVMASRVGRIIQREDDAFLSGRPTLDGQRRLRTPVDLPVRGLSIRSG